MLKEASRTKSSVSRPKAGASYPITAEWSTEQVLGLSKEDVIALWGDAPTATLEDLQGHFSGLIPNGGSPEGQARAWGGMYNENSRNGYWLGKAYRKTGANSGEGYNRWRLPGGKVVRNMPFITEVGKSFFDGKPSLLMYYGAYQAHNPTFVDEIRKLDDYIYLGVGSTLRDGKRNPGHFMLVGPTDEWVGGAVGELVKGFIKPTE